MPRNASAPHPATDEVEATPDITGDELTESSAAERDPGDLSEEDLSERSAVRREIDRVRGFVSELSLDDLRDGDWFARLLTFSLDRYKQEVDAAYFLNKYPGLPADAVVSARIQMAARYASVEGALSAAAYTGAVAATIGSAGGASPLTLPAGAASLVVDLVFTTQMQLRLAYDISVLYRVPLDLDDPDDLWKLIRLAFGIKSGEAGGMAATKAVPVVIRPLVKKIFSGATLAAVKSLPTVGKYLLQRNIIKMALPGVGVPLAAGINYWLTKVAGDHARTMFRTEARIIEAAEKAVDKTNHDSELLWALWLVICSDDKGVHDNQRLLMHHVTRLVAARNPHLEALAQVKDVIEVDEVLVWSLFASASGDLQPVMDTATLAAAIDGAAAPKELELLRELAACFGLDFSDKAVKNLARSWS